MPASAKDSQLRKGVLELAILTVLSRTECYSIEIIDHLAQYPALAAGPGTVYPLLARLEKAGTVTSRWVPSPAGPPRKYYRLTRDGRAALDDGRDAWATLSSAMSEILDRRELP